MRYSRKTPLTAGRFAFRIVCVIIVIVLGAGLYLATSGFPAWLTDEFTSRLSSGPFALKANGAKLMPWFGLMLEDVQLYRKGVIGPAIVDAEQVIVTLDPLAVFRDQSCLQRLQVSDADFRPRMARSQEHTRTAKPATRTSTRVELTRCRVHGIDVNEMSFVMNANGHVREFARIAGSLGNGARRGDINGLIAFHMRTRVLEGDIETSFDPHILLNLFTDYDMNFATRLVNRFSFRQTPPDCNAKFTKVCVPRGQFSLAGSFRLQDSTYRDVSVLRSDGHVDIAFSSTNHAVSVEPLLIVREEGIAKGGFTVDIDQRTVAFDAVSTVNPWKLARIIGINTNEAAVIYRCRGPLSVAGQGVVDYAARGRTDFVLNANGADLGMWAFVADSCSLTLHVCGPTNTVSGLTGKLYGGQLAGNAVIVRRWGAVSNTAYSITGRLDNADFQRIAGVLCKDKEHEYEGRFSGHIVLSGLTGEENADTVRGDGSVQIEDGRVFQLPIFGGFSRYMTKIIPGLDFVLRQSDASATFVIADQHASTKRVDIQGDLLSLTGRGKYHFNKDLDFEARVKLLKSHTLGGKLLQPIMYPISKLFEFRLCGNLAEPRWYLVNFSADLLKKLGFKPRDIRKEDQREQEEPAAPPAPGTDTQDKDSTKKEQVQESQ